MDIRWSEEENIIYIGDHKIYCYPMGNEVCQVCGFPKMYYEEYDALFCPVCNIWFDEGCGNADCEFCGNRPAFPVPII